MMSDFKHKILLVENEKEFLDPLREFVESLGYQVETACNGRQALDKAIDSGPFSVVITDQRMPEMFGTIFLGQLKLISPHTVRILVTAYEDRELIRDSVNLAEVFRILKKPIGLNELAQTLKLAIDKYEGQLKTLDIHKILFVDNQLLFLHSRKIHLSKYGYDVLTSNNSEEAIKIVTQQGPIAVVVTDESFCIGDVSILEIIKKVSPKTVKILFTLSKNSDLWEYFANKVGVFRVLSRLHDGDLLEEAVFSALNEYDRNVGNTLLMTGKAASKPK